jgi:hypothetical protein
LFNDQQLMLVVAVGGCYGDKIIGINFCVVESASGCWTQYTEGKE